MANTVKKSNGDVMLANTMPQAEYMYGCTPTSVGMLLGYYDLYGYNGTSMSNIIKGEVLVKSRGTDGDAYNMNAFGTVLGKAIASKGYVERFYEKTPEDELPHTFMGETTELNTAEWDCLADYLGTGQYWRGNTDRSTTETYSTLENLYKVTKTGTISNSSGSISRTFSYRNISMLYGLDLYVQSRGYTLDAQKTGTFKVDVRGGSFTFEQYMAEIDAGRPVIVSIKGHAMVGYGYNKDSREIIFDDCYRSDQRMAWDGTYSYSDEKRALESITVIVFNVSGGGGGGGTSDTVKPTVTNVKASTTAATNKNVTVTATFSDDVKLASSFYRVGTSGNWNIYPSSGVTVTQNSTVYFKAVDAAGNESSVVNYKVTNIDKTPPSKPTVSVSTKNTTTKPVTVTAKFSSDAAKKEYHLEGKGWTTYSGAITLTSNNTVYFRATDAAGNVSDIVSYTVSNIKGSTAPVYDTSACDDGSANEWVLTKDKSGTTLRNSDSNLASTTLSKSSTDVEIKVDKKSISKDGKHNFVGFDDLTDFAKIVLSSAAKLSFTTAATAAAKFTVYKLTTTYNKSKPVYKLKTLKTVTLKAGNNYMGEINDLLLAKESGTDYYISVKYTGAKNSGAYYNVNMKSSSDFFSKGNNSDDSPDLSSMKTFVLPASPGAKLLEDWVGFGDTIDYRMFTLSSAAKLKFEIKAGNAAKLTLYKVVTNVSKSSLRTVKSVSVKQGKSGEALLGLVEGGGTYALSVKSTAPAKSENAANYTLSLSSDCAFFNNPDSNTLDDEVIVNINGQGYVNSAVGDVGYLDDKADFTVIGPADSWVGYGDKIDFKKFSLKNDKTLTFGIQATDRVQFTLYELVTKTSGKTTKLSLKKLKSFTPKDNGEGTYVTPLSSIKITLKAGTNYYFSVKSTNAAKGGNAKYNVFLLPNDMSFKDALSMPETSTVQDELSAPSASDSISDDLFAGLSGLGAGDALASANLPASAQLQFKDSGTLQPLSGLLA